MSERLVQIRYLTTARGPNYRHDEGQVVEVELADARALVRHEIAETGKLDAQGRWVRVDLAELEREAEREEKAEPPEARVPETAEHPPAEKAVAPPQQRVGPRRRPADHEARPSKG